MEPGEKRGELLQRVRASLGATTTLRPEAPVVDERIARTVDPTGDLATRFERAATRQGLLVMRVRPADLTGAIVQLLDLHGVERVTLALSPGVESRAVQDALRTTGATIVERAGEPDKPQTHQYEAHASITDCRAAIAESGTLLYAVDALHDRGHPCVPPRHIVILPAERIVADLLDAVELIEGSPAGDAGATCESCSSVLLITGPSKTADIEGVLVTGIHGPTEVHVLVVECC